MRHLADALRQKESNIQRQFKCFKTHHDVDVAIEDMAFI